MGGIIILTSALLPILFWTQLTQEILFLVFITLFFALLGFVDDYLKIEDKSPPRFKCKNQNTYSVCRYSGLYVYT